MFKKACIAALLSSTFTLCSSVAYAQCGDGGDKGGGIVGQLPGDPGGSLDPCPNAGGGPGGTPSGALSFTSPTTSPLVIGGVSGREGPGVTHDPNNPYDIYVAYTSHNSADFTGDSYGDYYVIFGKNGSYSRIYPNSGNTLSDANPALATFNGKVYMTINSQQNSAYNYGGFSSVFRYTPSTGVWDVASGQPGAVSGFPDTSYSPAMAVREDGQLMVLGFRNAADETLVLCRFTLTETVTCTNFPSSRQMNFNPSLAYFNGVLYIAYEEYDNNHALRMFASTDNGQTIYETSNLSSDQTSTAPSLLKVNDYLHVAFRTNDSDRKFIWRSSTDGTNFGASAETGEHMGSAPALVLDGSGQYIYNYYSADDSSHYLKFTGATHN